MANKRILLGILVLALVFGMTVVGCSGGADDLDEDLSVPILAGSVSLDKQYPVVGETITASYVSANNPSSNSANGIGTPSWEWYKTQRDTSYSVADSTYIGSGTSYTVKQSDVGFWIWVRLSYSGNRSARSNITSSSVIGIPATATVSVSMSALYRASSSYDNHSVTVILTLSDGKWNDVSYSTASQWLTITGTPIITSWPYPSVSSRGRELYFNYSTRSDTTLPISNLTVTLNTDQLSTMRSNTNVYNTLTPGTSSASVSQWTSISY